MATYNGARYLNEQLESIAAQTLVPYELVVCDDGSSDDTMAILENFSRVAAFPVRVFRNAARLNFRANFMQAAQRCKGELIAFCDQDDIWHADKLSVVAAAFTDDEVLLVHHNARLFSETRGVTGSLIDPGRPSRLDAPLSRSAFEMPPGFTQTFRRSLLALSDLRAATIDFWGAAEALAHDQWIYILASALGTVAYLPEPLTDYRQHHGNLYGLTVVRRSRWQRFMERLLEYSDYGHLERAFGSMAHAFAAAAEYPLGEQLARRAAAAAAWYQALSQAYGDRRQAYAAASLRSRASAWMRLYRAGRYRPGRPFYFAHHGFARDFVHGVCRGRLRHPRAGLTANDRSLRLAPGHQEREERQERQERP
jgi:glycosyltransferase involved in cell wall biosynthesis